MAKAVKQNTNKPEPAKFKFSVPRGRNGYAIIIFCFAFALYFNSIFNDYNLDDELVTQNQALTSQGWKVVTPDFSVFSSVQLADSSFSTKMKYFVPEVFRTLYYQDKSGYKYEYRPLVQASFAVEHALFAQKNNSQNGPPEIDNPHISHFINVVLYALSCMLLLLVLSRLLSGYSILFSFVAALLFAAHPIHTEVVASIKNRDEILALLFVLISFIYAIKFAERRSVIYLIVIALCFTFSLLSKPTSIAFALLIPLALIMFSSISFGRLIVVTLVMSVFASFYARLYFVQQQLLLVGLLVAGISLAYVVQHFQEISNKVRIIISNFLESIKPGKIDLTVTKPELDFRFLLKPWRTILLAVLIIMLVGVAQFGAHQSWFWLSCLMGLICALIYILYSDEVKVIFITPITLILLIQLYNYHFHMFPPEVMLVIFLTHLIFLGNKYARIVAGINYLVFILFGLFVVRTNAYLLLLGLAGFYYPRLIYVSLAVLAASFWGEIQGIRQSLNGGHPQKLDLFIWPFVQLGLLVDWRFKKRWLHPISIIAIPVIVLIYVALYPPHQKLDLVNPVRMAYRGFIVTKAVDPTPVQSSVRPLKYVEYPVGKDEPYTKLLGLGAEVLLRYLKLVIVPYPMSYYYGYAYIVPKDLSAPLPVISVIIHVMVLVLALVFYRRKPILSYGLLLYLVSVALYANIVVPIMGIMADRFLLIPSIGFCLMLSLLLFALFKEDIKSKNLNFNLLPKTLRISLYAILAVYGLITISRNFDWKDRLTLFRHDINTVENSAQAQNLLAVNLFANANKETSPQTKRELAQEATVHFKRALEIYPDFVNASFDLGRTYEFLEEPDEAYKQYAHIASVDTLFSTPIFNMAVIQHRKNNFESAVSLYEKYISLNPMQVQAYNNLSYAYFQMGQYDNAINANLRALKIAPGSYGPLVNIGKTYMVENKNDSALIYFRQAEITRPNDATVNALINQLTSGKPDK